MANFNSIYGRHYPAHERAVVMDKSGEPKYDKNDMPIVYDGPDRDALSYLKDGEEYLGHFYADDAEVIDLANAKRMSIDQFCKTSINTEEKMEAYYAEVKKRIVNHRNPEKKPSVKSSRSGGSNFAANEGHMYGGFGLSPYRK